MGTLRQKSAKDVLKANFKIVTAVSAIACRPIDCVNKPCDWSQHAYGNALDIYALPKELDKIAVYLRSMGGASQLGVKYAAWRVRNHFDHMHLDFWPTGTGTPSCAGGSPTFVNGTASNLNFGADVPNSVPELFGADFSLKALPGQLVEALPGNIEDIGPGIANATTAIGQFLAVFFNPKTWQRALQILSGLIITYFALQNIFKALQATSDIA